MQCIGYTEAEEYLQEVAAISPECRSICGDHSCARRACEAGDEVASLVTGGSILALHCTRPESLH